MTRDEWLDSLEWHESPPPKALGYGDLPAGIVVRTTDGTICIVGDVNRVGGSCDCCRSFDTQTDIAAWARIPGIPHEGHEINPEDAALARDWKARGIA